jgi:hypothetical protein
VAAAWLSVILELSRGAPCAAHTENAAHSARSKESIRGIENFCNAKRPFLNMIFNIAKSSAEQETKCPLPSRIQTHMRVNDIISADDITIFPKRLTKPFLGEKQV